MALAPAPARTTTDPFDPDHFTGGRNLLRGTPVAALMTAACLRPFGVSGRIMGDLRSDFARSQIMIEAMVTVARKRSLEHVVASRHRPELHEPAETVRPGFGSFTGPG
jgi:hypothetical protein